MARKNQFSGLESLHALRFLVKLNRVYLLQKRTSTVFHLKLSVSGTAANNDKHVSNINQKFSVSFCLYWFSYYAWHHGCYNTQERLFWFNRSLTKQRNELWISQYLAKCCIHIFHFILFDLLRMLLNRLKFTCIKYDAIMENIMTKNETQKLFRYHVLSS